MSTPEPTEEPTEEPAEEKPTAEPADGTPAPPRDPLRSSVTARIWLSLVALVVLLVLLVVFVAQNTEHVALKFFGWTWHPPLAVAILAATACGLALAVVTGTLRIWQLRHRVRRGAGGA